MIDGILIVSDDGRIVYYNQRFLQIWNFPPRVLASGLDADALAWAAGQTVNPDAFLAEVESILSAEKEWVCSEVAMRDGRIYERYGGVVMVEEKERLWLWSYRDVTAARRADDAVRQGELRYRTLLTSLDVGFCIIDVIYDEAGRGWDYRFLEVNPAFAAHTGMVDVVGRSVREMLPQHEQFWFDTYGEIARSRIAARFESPASALGRWYDVYAFPIDAPELSRLGVLFTDVTQQKRATEALQASELFNRRIMDSSPDCIKVLDQHGRLKFMNSFGQGIMEIDDVQKFYDQPWEDLWGASNRSLVQEAIAAAFAGRTGRFQARCPTAKGTLKWWDVMVAPLEVSVNGRSVESLLSVSRDISELKRVEEALQQAKEQAELASRAKDDFLAALSHELRTPLNPVLLTASEMSADESLPSSVRDQMRMIQRNVALEARLIDDLLDLTRITRGKLVLQMAPCKLHTLLELVVEMFRSDAQSREVSLMATLAAPHSVVNGDAARLQQVFWNLIGNAVKFSPQGGCVSVRTSEITNTVGAPMLRVEVADDGIGIAPHLIESIFQPFEQGVRARDEALGGLGLGLAIARSIVERHAARIWAESLGLGRGATFIVELPLEGTKETFPDCPTPPTPVADAGSARVSLRLLVVEDHEPTLQVVARLLERDGHTVVTAKTLAGARRIVAESEPFDGLISDLGLPDGTGLELMAEMKAAKGLRGIVLSGYGMEEDIRRSREAGFVAHLVKPVEVADIRWALAQLSAEVR